MPRYHGVLPLLRSETMFMLHELLFGFRSNLRAALRLHERVRAGHTHPPKLSVGGDRAIDLADNVSDAFWSNLGAVLAIPWNFAMVARPERC